MMELFICSFYSGISQGKHRSHHNNFEGKLKIIAENICLEFGRVPHSYIDNRAYICPFNLMEDYFYYYHILFISIVLFCIVG